MPVSGGALVDSMGWCQWDEIVLTICVPYVCVSLF